MTKYVSLILLFSVAVFISFEKNLFDFLLSPEAKISKKWSRDLENLKTKGHLHKSFNQVTKINWSFSSPAAEAFFKKVKKPNLFQEVAQEPFELEIFIDDFEKGFMVQINLVEKKSGNTVWELSRTYTY